MLVSGFGKAAKVIGTGGKKPHSIGVSLIRGMDFHGLENGKDIWGLVGRDGHSGRKDLLQSLSLPR